MVQTDFDHAPPVDVVAGKYRVERILGRGGMGTVWEARHISLGTLVAVKFIDGAAATDPEMRRRFDVEARAAARLKSKHVAQVHDHGVTDGGVPYIVMERLLGESLEARLDRQGKLTPSAAFGILRQVGRALSRAHDAGVLHRDLKPDNVFLHRGEDDDEEVAKVVDFGVAKMGAGPLDSSGSTRSGALVGTPLYMSPEQTRGSRTIDARTNLWSLAVMTYRALTGESPFAGENVGDVIVKISTVEPRAPSLVAPELPFTLDAWVERALAKDPAQRFSSATEQTHELGRALGVAVPVVEDPLPSRSTSVGSRHISADAATLAATGISMRSSNAATSRTRPLVIGSIVLVLLALAAVVFFRASTPDKSAVSPAAAAPPVPDTVTTAPAASAEKVVITPIPASPEASTTVSAPPKAAAPTPAVTTAGPVATAGAVPPKPKSPPATKTPGPTDFGY